jgi:hypothetical protein
MHHISSVRGREKRSTGSHESHHVPSQHPACSELVAKAWRDAFGEELAAPTPVELGTWAARAAQMTNGELVNGTPMVSPADLVRSGRLTRVVDELHP